MSRLIIQYPTRDNTCRHEVRLRSELQHQVAAHNASYFGDPPDLTALKRGIEAYLETAKGAPKNVTHRWHLVLELNLLLISKEYANRTPKTRLVFRVLFA